MATNRKRVLKHSQLVPPSLSVILGPQIHDYDDYYGRCRKQGSVPRKMTI